MAGNCARPLHCHFNRYNCNRCGHLEIVRGSYPALIRPHRWLRFSSILISSSTTCWPSLPALAIARRLDVVERAARVFADASVVLLYLASVLPLLGPLSRWTHVQLSVPAFAALLWGLWRQTLAPTHNLHQTNPPLYNPSSNKASWREDHSGSRDGIQQLIITPNAFLRALSHCPRTLRLKAFELSVRQKTLCESRNRHTTSRPFRPCTLAITAQSKPKLTLDEFVNSVSFPALENSPDGNSVVIVTQRADWDQQIIRKDLSLYRDDGKGGIPDSADAIRPRASKPEWSPDGSSIAFLSERTAEEQRRPRDSDSDSGSKGEPAQVYLISPNGGEASASPRAKKKFTHFRGRRIRRPYFATRQPWSKQQKDDYKKEWKNVMPVFRQRAGRRSLRARACSTPSPTTPPEPRARRKKTNSKKYEEASSPIPRPARAP